MIPFVVYYVISFVYDKLSEERFSEDALLEKVVYYLNYLTCYRMYLAEFRKKRLGGGGGGSHWRDGRPYDKANCMG